MLFVTHRYPPHTGGVETHVQELATRLVDRGHDVTVFSADAGSDVDRETTDEGVRVCRFRSFNPGGAFYVAPQMAVAVRQFDADVVHAHNYHAFPLFFAALGVEDERLVVTTHYHGASASRFRDALLSLYRPFGRWAVRRADEVIAVSEWERERLGEDFGVDATVIPNGVDVERFTEAEPEDWERPYLLCVGRLEKYKGIQYVIRSLSELPAYDLVVAGDGPYRDELVAIAHEDGVDDRVQFLGFVDQDRLQGLYSGATVFVTLSEFESYGVTVAEALAAGTPCVVRGAGALTDWIDNPGVVGVEEVTPTNVQRAVNETREQEVDRDAIPNWERVTDDVEGVYRV